MAWMISANIVGIHRSSSWLGGAKRCLVELGRYRCSSVDIRLARSVSAELGGARQVSGELSYFDGARRVCCQRLNCC